MGEQRHDAQGGEADRLVEELGAVAVRSLRVEPMEEQDRGAAPTVLRLHEVGLDLAHRGIPIHQIGDGGVIPLIAGPFDDGGQWRGVGHEESLVVCSTA